ncbi:MAG: PAS domain S-box protein [Actinomycetota bacterium]
MGDVRGHSLIRGLEELRPGDHLCCIYQSEDEHRALVTSFLRHGLERGEKVIYIVDNHTAEEVLGYLERVGIETSPFLDSGQLTVLTVDDAYMKDGVFDPDGMIAMLREETDKAASQGYAVLRVTGEMTWALRGLPGSERLIEYEAKLNHFFPSSRCMAICQYDRRRFNPELLLDVLSTHPIAVIGSEVFENFYYVPPEQFIGGDPYRAVLENRILNLSARHASRSALEESERKYRTIVDNAQEGIWVIDGDMRTTFVNRRMADMLGYSEGEMLGRPILDFVDDGGRTEIERSMGGGDRGTSRQYEVEFLRKDGSRIFTNVAASPLTDDAGTAAGALAMVSDITERKRAEDEVRESEGRLKAIADASGDFIIMLDTDHRIRFINRVEQGIDPDALIGTPLYEMVDEEDRDRVRTHLNRALFDNRRQEYETVFHRPDGADIYYSSVAVPLVVGEEVIGIVVNSRDITERKQAEEAVRESEEKFRSIVEQSTDGIVLVDGEGTVIEWNSAMEDISGLRREQAIGKALWEVQYLTLLPEQRDPRAYGELKEMVLGPLEKGFESWFGETIEREMLSPEGERRIIQTASFPIRSREGMMVGNITRDITRRVQVENDLAYEVEVNRAIAEMSSALLAQVSIEEVSYVVLENSKRLTGSRYGYVGYIEADTGHLISPTLSRDIWEQCDVEDKNIVFSKFGGLWGWVLENREPLLTNAPGEDPRSTGVPAGHIPIERFVSVPALLGGALVGQIALANSDRDYTRKDIEVLNRLADLYAMAVLRMWSEDELSEYREHLEELVRERTQELERTNRQLQEEITERRKNQDELRATAEQLRALSARVESVREEERRHVAREVHDTLGQSLTGLKINLSLLGRKLAGSEEVDEISYMSDLIDATIQSVREISTQLRPGVIDDLGLAAALDWQLKRFEEMTGLKCSFVSRTEDESMDKDLAITLFRIAQEALTNIARHAGAGQVEVLLAQEPQEIVLRIKDDGRGISRQEVEDRGSLGILGMRERAHIYGGEVEISGGEREGTTVVVRIPLGGDDRAGGTPQEEGGYR